MVYHSANADLSQIWLPCRMEESQECEDEVIEQSSLASLIHLVCVS